MLLCNFLTNNLFHRFFHIEDNNTKNIFLCLEWIEFWYHFSGGIFYWSVGKSKKLGLFQIQTYSLWLMLNANTKKGWFVLLEPKFAIKNVFQKVHVSHNHSDIHLQCDVHLFWNSNHSMHWNVKGSWSLTDILHNRKLIKATRPICVLLHNTKTTNWCHWLVVMLSVFFQSTKKKTNHCTD